MTIRTEYTVRAIDNSVDARAAADACNLELMAAGDTYSLQAKRETIMNTLQIGQKVKYQNQIATVVDTAPPFGEYPVVVLEFKAIFADFGPNYAQIDRRSVIEYGLEVVQ